MSYILDALARSHTAQAEVGLRKLTNRSLWQQGAIALLLALVVVMATTYLRAPPPRAEASQAVAAAPSQPPRTATALTEVPAMAARSPGAASAPATNAPPLTMAAAPRSDPALTVVARAAAAPRPAPLVSPVDIARPAPRFQPPTALSQPLPNPSPMGPGGSYAATQLPTVTTARTPRTVASSVGAPARADALAAAPATSRDTPETRAVALSDMGSPSALPPPVRAALARMKVKVLFHTPQRRNRFVMIDNRALREGDELFDGLRVEEITHAGLVVRHKDTLVLAPTLAAR